MAALAFAAITIPLGALFAFDALGEWEQASAERYAGSRRTERAEATGFAECSLVALLPGLYYGLVGLRGLASAAVRPGT